MKTIIFFALILFSTASYAAQTFSGTVTKYSNPTQPCVPEATQEAEVIADKSAEDFCDTFSMKANRITDFHVQYTCSRIFVPTAEFGRRANLQNVAKTNASAQFRCQ